MIQQLKSHYLSKSLAIFHQNLDDMKQKIQQQHQKYNQFIQLQRHIYLEPKAIFIHNFFFPFKNVKNDLVYINFLPQFDINIQSNSNQIQTIYNQPQNFIIPVQIQSSRNEIVTRFLKHKKFSNYFMKVNVYKKVGNKMKLNMQSFNPFVLKSQKQNIQNIQCLGIQSIENQIINNYLDYIQKSETEIHRDFQIQILSQEIIQIECQSYRLQFKLECLEKQQIKMELFNGWIYNLILEDFIENSQKIRFHHLVYEIDRFLGYN